MMDSDVAMRSDTMTTPTRRRSAPPVVALGLVALLALTACGGSSEPTAEAAETTVAPTTAPTTSTLAPTTTRASTTTSTSTTSTTRAPKKSTTTTSSTSTTVPKDPSEITHILTTTTTLVKMNPIAPPADSYASEPVIEVGTISIPKIGVEMTMFEGIRMTTLDYGPGHWPGTAMPGQAGNVVVGGHRTSKHKVFRRVDELAAGDEIIFTDERGTHTYAVNRVEVVDPTAVWIVNPTDTPTATLFACHPPGSTRQRIVVFADLVSG